MSFKILLLILRALCFVNCSKFPIILDQNCFVNFVFENSKYLEYPETLEIPEISESLQNDKTYIPSYTIYDVENLNFSFDIDELVFEDKLTLSDGYFRFHSKYRNTCNLFLLLTASFNATTTAITKSGHGTSESTLFLVILPRETRIQSDEEDLLSVFPTQFKLLESETNHAFYANLAFVSFHNSENVIKAEIYVYCYYCSEHVGHLHLLGTDQNIYPSAISWVCKRWNSNGYARSLYVLSLYAGSPEMNAKWLEPIGQARGNFYKSMRNHFFPTTFALHIVTRRINISVDALKLYDIESENEIYWYLTVKEITPSNFILRNVQAVTRSTIKIFDQKALETMYCMNISDLVKIKWDIYLTVLDFPTWLLIGLIFVAYTFLYKNVAKAMDLLWIVFDMNFWLRHPREILVFYLVGAIFLPWVYKSGMSTDFVSFDTPSSINKMIKSGYRIWVSPLDDVRESTYLWPEHTKKLFLKDVHVKYVSDVFSKMYDFELPSSLRKQIKAIAKNKFLLVNALQDIPYLTHVLSEKKVVVVENDIVCGTVSLTSRYGYQLVHAYEFRGYMSTKLFHLFSGLEETGIIDFYRSMITFQNAFTTKLNVQDLSSAISSSTLAVRTPLGVVCLAFVVVNISLLASNVVLILYINRRIVSQTSSEFPLKLDQTGFVNFIWDDNVYAEYPKHLQIPEIQNPFQNVETYSQTFTVHDVEHLNFSFEIEDLLVEDRLSLTDGYFRFQSKYRQICSLFLLFTTSFNATTTAITKSGYGTSQSTLFLVIISAQNPNGGKDDDLLEEFSTQYKLLESETQSAFYPNLAFATFQDSEPELKENVEIYVYCYYCPDSIGHLHLLEIKWNITIAMISSKSRRLNNQGYKRSVYELSPFAGRQDKIRVYKPIGDTRDKFYNSLKRRFLAAHFVFDIIVNQKLNMTYYPILLEYQVEEKNEVYWHLSLKEIVSANLMIRNLLANTRSTYRTVDQMGIHAMYCMDSYEVLS
ncbi:unnamed protein product [Orchesella dallaii]|uniref:Uncharacterized protein n=1 Tax=Orchesella dallaii TaxID=48710 RepID=A0ABP1PNV2_9HEXA